MPSNFTPAATSAGGTAGDSPGVDVRLRVFRKKLGRFASYYMRGDWETWRDVSKLLLGRVWAAGSSTRRLFVMLLLCLKTHPAIVLHLLHLVFVCLDLFCCTNTHINIYIYYIYNVICIYVCIQYIWF